MNPDQLRALRALRGLTLAELHEREPNLAAEIDALLNEAHTQHFIVALRLPDEVAGKLRRSLTSSASDKIEQLQKILKELGYKRDKIEALLRQAQALPSPSAKEPVGSLPIVGPLIAQGHMHEVLAVAGISGAVAQTIASTVKSTSAIDDGVLAKLVSERKLTDEQANALGFATTLYQLTDEHTPLATVVLTTPLAALRGNPARSTVDLAALRPADWATFLAAHPTTIPDGTTAEQFGSTLSARFSALHPSRALLGRLTQLEHTQILNDLLALEPLRTAHSRVLGTPPETLGKRLSDEQRALVLPAQRRLVQLTNKYGPLELQNILDDVRRSPQSMLEALDQRLSLIGKVGETLGGTEFLQLDLSADSVDLAKLGLAGIGATVDEQQMILKTLRSYQRTWMLAKDADASVTLVSAGFDSALAVGRLSADRFQRLSGLPVQSANAVWESARSMLADVTLTAGSIVDIIHGISGRYDGNQSPSAANYLKHLAGFQDLFGNLSLCSCEECQSVLGASAYFVDLMKYIDDNLRVQFPGANHPLDLKTRRPDLWTLELSCDNTKQRVALLDIVNTVLENYIALSLGYAGALSDRKAISTLVYKETLSVHIDSFRQPFRLPPARIASYLSEFSASRADVAKALGATAAVWTQAELYLSSSDLSLVTTPAATLPSLRRLYNIVFTGTTAAIEQVDAEMLASAMGIKRSELGALVATWFAGADGATVTIVATKRDVDSVQNDVEWVRGLSADALDRMHRFTRLLWKTGWEIPDLDLILKSLGDTALSAAGVQAVARLHGLVRSFSITVQEAAALIGPVPQTPADASLFDRLFNPPSYVATDGSFPQASTHFVHPAFRSNTPTPVDPNLPRLLSALGVNLDDLASLARHLSPYLEQELAPSFDPNMADENERYFVLSAPNLTLLYRHARLAKLLGLSVEDLFELLGFVQLDHVTSLENLEELLDFYNWYSQSGYKLDDIAIANGRVPRILENYPDAPTLANTVVTAMATGLNFTTTVFAVALGTSEQGSADLIVANPMVIEPGPNDTWRLVAGVDLATAALNIPASATVPTPPTGNRLVTAAEVSAALRNFLVAEVLVRSLGKAFGLSIDKIKALALLAGQSLTAPEIVTAVRGDGPVDPLVGLVGALIPLRVAFANDALDAAAIDFMRTHAALFGADPLPNMTPDAQHPRAPFLTLTQLRGVATYARLAQRQTGAAPNMTPVDPLDVQAVLTGFDEGLPAFSATTDATMAHVLNVPRGLVVGLRNVMSLSNVAAIALDQFDQAARMAATLGVDGDTFAALISDDYDILSHAADALIAAIRSRIADEQTLTAKLDELEQPIREAKRNALADYLLNSLAVKLWSSFDDLYEYFLIDINAGGCETTSPVVAATMSAQLYVYRAIMNLEQDALAADDPKHFVLTMPPDAAEEWDWRKNFRVWQANRKVYLWPENYLQPDLRDDKTPLFEEIEQELLQTGLSDQNVFDAYTKYLAGLTEVSSLAIAGAYHEYLTAEPEKANAKGGVTDVLHLFGCTADDPPIYYYRTCQNLIAGGRDATTAPLWSPWRKIMVHISSRRVAPVVHKGRLHVFWSDCKTRPKNEIRNGASVFTSYQHQMNVRFSTLRADGKWTAVQTLRLPPGPMLPGGVSALLSDPYTSTMGPSRGTIVDFISNFSRSAHYDIQGRDHSEPIDDYSLVGPNWDGVWPLSWRVWGGKGLEISYRNFIERRQVDLFNRTVFDLQNPSITDVKWPYPQLLAAKSGSDTLPLFCGVPVWMPYPPAATANVVIEERRIDIIELDWGVGNFKPYVTSGLYSEQIASIPAQTQLLAVPGSVEDGILQVSDDILMLQGSVTDDGGYILTRIGTTLVADIARRLFEDGVDSVLDIRTQLQLAEAGLPITLVGGKISDRSNTGTLDFKGAYGNYYREVFFYLPWLIANALNARGSYEACHRWYRYIFDPTANELIDVTGLPPDEAAHRLLDRVWRYREFRGLEFDTLRKILTDPSAIAQYKRDPFNPWTIARRRISAFQKAIVMAVVGNLLDWGDSLFAQFTMESVNEAMMLYIMAQDILGPRPVELGDCGEGIEPANYEEVGPLIESSSEILIELETWILGQRYPTIPIWPSSAKFVPPTKAIQHVAERFPLTKSIKVEPNGAPVRADAAVDLLPVVPLPERTSLFTGLDWTATRTTNWAPALANSVVKTKDAFGGRTSGTIANKDKFGRWAGRFGFYFVRQLIPVFCVPANTTLLDYWARVEDRLYKIRHCQDIDGNLRELALFAPPINPMQLVAMKAAGLSLDDVLASSQGDLPPYRFTVLIERAKSFAATLSGFGASLLSAREKIDLEQLNHVRMTQQMNLAQMTTRMRQGEIDAASASLEALTRQLDAAQYRSDFYSNLISSGRSDHETAQSIAQHTASGIKGGEATMGFLAATFGLMPQIGSPFAMKYGGVELHTGARSHADATGCLAAIAESVAISTALEANFGRRSEGWKNLKALADYDKKVLNKQIDAATIRLAIANDALDLHQKSIEQIQELLDLAEARFTNLGLYTWLSSQLQTFYRGAYQNALAMAMLAQQAFRFERGEDTMPGLSMAYWDPTFGGLLAGERLLIDLQSLERRYYETNYRTLEIDQPFPLSQIDPQALVDLRETGECSFTINETFIDLVYPGHYKRRIRAVRLTIPCLTGPYVNVSATLTLEANWIRPSPTLGGTLVEVPPSRSIVIATSTAQNDSGVFELSFRDERYMPFEGLGVVSQWRLTLPKVFRQFDYQTINDVILSVSYSALLDGSLRDRVESSNAGLVGSIVNYFTTQTAKRLFSLRQDFSNAFTRLLRSPVGTKLTMPVTERNMPMLARGRTLSVTRGVLLLRTASGDAPEGFTITIDGTVVPNFVLDPTLGGLPSASLPGAFSANLYADHTFVVSTAGNLAPVAPPPGDVSALDSASLMDILLYLEYKFQ
jgi:hypothetical protein